MPKYVYTFSSRERMPHQIVRSIRTLIRFVDASDVVVFYTPPHREDHRETVARLGVDLRVVDNETDPFVAMEWFDDAPRHYGAKTRIGDVEADTAVFLDCDTLVLGDITECLEGEFQFKARPGSAPTTDEWERLFESRGCQVLEWMPNAGFLVFRDGIHREIQDDWRRFLAEGFDGYSSEGVSHREQYALALAVSEYDCTRMTPREHVMEWVDEPVEDGIVYHLGRPPVRHEVVSVRKAVRKRVVDAAVDVVDSLG